MKILFIAPYKQNDEWGDSSRHYIKSLNLTGHDITVRPIYFSNQLVASLSDEILKLEAKSHPSYDVVIQKSLPHFVEPHGHFKKSIGLCNLESANYQYHTPWVRQMNLMDEIWTITQHQKDTLKQCGVNVPIKVVGIPIETDVAIDEYSPLEIEQAKDTFVFYYMGEFSERSNLEALVTAFHTEFHYSEPVNLVINSNLDKQHFENFINEIKSKLRVYSKIQRYHPDIVITPLADSKTAPRVHKACNCFVVPSHGEVFQRHLVNALVFGNFVLTGDHSGLQDFIPTTDWLIWSQQSICSVKQPPLPHLYTGNETWYTINTVDLRKKMRAIYETKIQTIPTKEHIQKICSYESIAKNINKALE